MKSAERGALALLKATAELHAAAASEDPLRWSVAWASLCDAFQCAPVFGVRVTPDRSSLAAIAVAARHCSNGCNAPCTQGSPSEAGKHGLCSVLVDHLDVLGAGAKPTQNNGFAVLDAVQLPMLLCRTDGILLYANAAFNDDAELNQILRIKAGRLLATDLALQNRLTVALAATSARGTAKQSVHIDAPTAHLTLRRLEGSWDVPVILLCITLPKRDLPGAERLQVPPRQQELARLLLVGHSLASAAAAMGIGTRTVKDHLRGLFLATGTRQQQDLIRQLSHHPF